MVILDEVTEAWNFKLVSVEDIIAVIEAKHPLTELVLTGRFAPDELVERADLVTEFRQVKHPFESGVKARRGIEY
jgi:cob(I)alamin adenosyltransferase